MSYDIAWELLNSAVLELATSGKPPRARLIDAAAHHLNAVEPAKHFADMETRIWFSRLMGQLCAAPTTVKPCRFAAAIDKLSDEQVDEALIEIVSLYDEVTRQDADGRLARAA